MIGADVLSTNHERPAGVADRLHCAEHGIRASSSEISAVLKSKPTRADFSHDSDRLEIEARSRAFDALALGVGAADILARGASDDDGGKETEISQKSLCRKGANIFVKPHIWIVFGVERAAPIDLLAGGHGVESGAVEAQRPSAGGGAEKIERGKRTIRRVHHPAPPSSQAAPGTTIVARARRMA